MGNVRLHLLYFGDYRDGDGCAGDCRRFDDCSPLEVGGFDDGRIQVASLEFLSATLDPCKRYRSEATDCTLGAIVMGTGVMGTVALTNVLRWAGTWS